MQTIEHNTEIGNATKPVMQEISGPFAYSICKGVVSPITQLERVYSEYPTLSTHCLTQAQILEIGGAA